MKDREEGVYIIYSADYAPKQPVIPPPTKGFRQPKTSKHARQKRGQKRKP